GSVIRLGVPNLGVSGQLILTVTGVVTPRAPGSAFWTDDATAARPALISPPDPHSPSYWVRAVPVPPAEALVLQHVLGPRLTATWEIPLTFSAIRGDQVQQLSDAVSQVTSQPPGMPGGLGAAATAVTVTSGLLRPLQQFVATTQALDT